jgi:hypothetical protein
MGLLIVWYLCGLSSSEALQLNNSYTLNHIRYNQGLSSSVSQYYLLSSFGYLSQRNFGFPISSSQTYRLVTVMLGVVRVMMLGYAMVVLQYQFWDMIVLTIHLP